MTIDKRLSRVQLEIVMHLANGKQIDEIAVAMGYSRSNINKQLATARRHAHAKTLPHLVSICIGAGALVWEPEDQARALK